MKDARPLSIELLTLPTLRGVFVWLRLDPEMRA